VVVLKNHFQPQILCFGQILSDKKTFPNRLKFGERATEGKGQLLPVTTARSLYYELCSANNSLSH